jgi:hypothetical protein
MRTDIKIRMTEYSSRRLLSRNVCCVIALFFAPLSSVYGQGNVFKHIRYNGGTFYTKVSPKDWHNQLTVTSELITFKLRDDQEIQILSKLVTSLTYGQEANRLYFIGIQYTSPKGEKSGLLLQGDKNNYGAILEALQSVTSLPIEINESNRNNMPLGLRTTLNVIGDAPRSAESSAQPDSVAKATQYGNLVVTSDPPESDVFVDGAYVGITPAAIDLIDGKHTVRVSSHGYADWSREISVILRSKVTLAATLEKQK